MGDGRDFQCIAAFPAAVFLGWVLQGCAGYARIRPGPGAALAPDDLKAAFSAKAGVDVSARGNTWTGEPIDLETIYAPIRVEVTNRSGHPLRIGYEQFALSLSSGTVLHAIPPIAIRGKVREPAPGPVLTPGFVYDGFFAAPYSAPYFVGVPSWPGAYPMEWGYYDNYFPEWTLRLPTQDMIRNAIPEGVLQDGGHLAGFLYFSMPPKGRQLARLGMKLVDARSMAAYGRVDVPLEVKR